MEKYLDLISDAIVGVFGFVFKWFGHKDEVQAVREKVASMCGFLPAAASVAAMFAAGGPVTGVLGIATAICQAVSASPAQSLFSSKAPTVNGVPIDGEWVGGK